jgi:hypothetical protein
MKGSTTMADKHRILGIKVSDRVRNAGGMQDLFTEYGCNIKTRIGLHPVSGDFCSPNGLVLLELFGDNAICDEFKSKLEAIEGCDIQEMTFDLG